MNVVNTNDVEYCMRICMHVYAQKSNYQQFAAFYVVIVVKPINADCSVQDIIRRAEPESVTSKNLSIVITRTIPSECNLTITGWHQLHLGVVL